MKRSIKITMFVATALTVFGLVSCKKYLDRPPEATITEQDVFANFRSFQGFTEELYHCLPDMSKSTWNNEWNTGDDILNSTNSEGYRLTGEFDRGNYRAWQTGGGGWDNSWLDDQTTVTGTHTGNNVQRKGLWPLSWYGIRKTNVGLANLDRLANASAEEKNVLKGQLLFFRGFFHFQLMSFWGGLPYIDTVLSSTGKLDLPRLSYRETALRAAQDLEDAAALLPANWDGTAVGQLTQGLNSKRITSAVALAFKGKTLLYAASPMMNQEETGSNTYDQELCKQAADAFARMLKESSEPEGSGASRFKLLTWDTWGENVFTISNNGRHPGGTEVVFGPPTYDAGSSRWSLVNMFIPPPLGGEAGTSSPAANYVNYFGMANGLPLDAAGSGYDIADPWSNRDPRFYKSIVYDGVRMIRGTGNANYRFANLFNGGNLRLDNTASRSGYLLRKFTTEGCNNTDNEWGSLNIIIPYLRLADVYLMYAEAVLHGYGTPQSSHSGYITALEAVNKIRTRANVPPVDAQFTGSKDAFMGELMRERAVELAFEGLRWHDLRRWNLAGEQKYKEKTVIDFDRGSNGKPINLRERIVVTRVFEAKHKWLPLPNNQVNLYPEFGQNPGW